MTAATRSGEAELAWRPAPLTGAVATCAAAALVVAVIAGRWQLVAFAAPLLGVLCAIGRQPPVGRVFVSADPGQVRCFESDRVPIAVWATVESTELAADLTVCAPDGLRLDAGRGGPAQRRDVAVSAERWGRYRLQARLQVVARGGLLAGTAAVDVAGVYVFPVAPPQPTRLPLADLPDRLGIHLTRHLGPGVEYADIRGYLPGDPLRIVNWAVSARRGDLFVTERLTNRAADVVVVLDHSVQPAGPATAAAERAASGAAQVVQSALRNGDRAGIVVLGGSGPRWFGADIGQRQFYRVLDTILGAGSDFETTTGTLAPHAAVPPGAIVVAFSTLLDTAFALALIELGRRGHAVAAVDVLDGPPFAVPPDPLIQRMWALERSAMCRHMAAVGVDVVGWPQQVTLDQALQLTPDRRRRVRG